MEWLHFMTGSEPSAGNKKNNSYSFGMEGSPLGDWNLGFASK
jgi:hypothetical protein